MTITTNGLLDIGFNDIDLKPIEPEPIEPEPIEPEPIPEIKAKISRKQQKEAFKLLDTEKSVIASILISQYRAKNAIARNADKDNCKRIIKECKNKQLVCNAFLGKPVSKDIKEHMENIYTERFNKIDIDLSLNKITAIEAENRKSRLIKPVFVPTRKTKDGSEKWRLYDNAKNREPLTEAELMQIAEGCNLQRSKMQELKKALKTREDIKYKAIITDKEGLQLFEAEKTINSIVNLSSEWLQIKGIAFDIESFEMQKIINKYQTRFDRLSSRIRYQNFKLSCMKVIDDLEANVKVDNEYKQYAENLGICFEEIQKLIKYNR